MERRDKPVIVTMTCEAREALGQTEEHGPRSLAARMENDASSYDNDPEPWEED